MRLKFRQLRVIVISWMIMGVLITLYDHFVLTTDNSLGLSPSYSIWMYLVRNIGAGLFGALIGGSLMVFYINEKLQDKPYAYTLLLVFLGFIGTVALISITMGLILVPVKTGKPLTDPETQAALYSFLRDPSHIKAAMSWSLVVAITQLLLQVNSKFGQANFWNIIRGKYNQPREEQRVFMFLDINDSTSIAETLGDERYHSLLKDFFADITSPILDNRGSIYQYVGDEVVVAWLHDDGIRDAHCVRCFFDMKQRISSRSEHYTRKYGLVPGFKAGIHCGRVIAGEVGIIKRDITYSGDVLNTTSRILGKCNEYKREIIASSDLIEILNFPAGYSSQPLGSIQLKGKSKSIELSAVVPS